MLDLHHPGSSHGSQAKEEDQAFLRGVGVCEEGADGTSVRGAWRHLLIHLFSLAFQEEVQGNHDPPFPSSSYTPPVREVCEGEGVHADGG